MSGGALNQPDVAQAVLPYLQQAMQGQGMPGQGMGQGMHGQMQGQGMQGHRDVWPIGESISSPRDRK